MNGEKVEKREREIYIYIEREREGGRSIIRMEVCCDVAQ